MTEDDVREVAKLALRAALGEVQRQTGPGTHTVEGMGEGLRAIEWQIRLIREAAPVDTAARLAAALERCAKEIAKSTMAMASWGMPPGTEDADAREALARAMEQHVEAEVARRLAARSHAAAAEESPAAGAAILMPGGFAPAKAHMPPPPVLVAARMAVRKFTSTLVNVVAHPDNLAAWSAAMTRIAREVIEPAFGPVDLAVTLEVDSEGLATEVFTWGRR